MAMMVESGTKPGSGSGLNSFPVSHSDAVLQYQQHDEAQRQREDIGQIERAAAGPMVEKFRCSTCSAITKNAVNGTR